MKMRRQDVPYTQVANEILTRPDLDLAVKGLFAYLFSKPEGWDFSSYRIAEELGVSHPTIQKYLRVLIKFGLLRRKRHMTGRVDYLLAFAPDTLPDESQETLNFDDKEPQSKEFIEGSTEPRIKKSQDKKSLSVSNKDKYIKSNWIDESKEKTPAFREFIASRQQNDYLSQRQIFQIFVEEFVPYWTEKSPGGKKALWEMQKVFDYQRRFDTWLRNYHGRKKDHKCPHGRWIKTGEHCYCVKPDHMQEKSVDKQASLLPPQFSQMTRDLAAKKKI